MSCECEYIGGGLGAGPLGGMPFGTQMPTDVAIGLDEPRAITLNQVVVPYTGDIGFPNPLNPVSPLNADNWTLTVIDPPSAIVRLIQNVQLVNETTLPTLLPNTPQLAVVDLPAFLITFDGPLTQGALYEIVLFQEDVEPGACDCSQFRALYARPDAIPSDGRDSDGYIIDIANPYVRRDALQLPPVLGSYQITDKGDLGLDKSGEASLRKRLQRRMVSAATDFFHLVGYGAGVRPKELIRPSTLQRLQSVLRAQLLKEPEVTSVQVSVTRRLGDPVVVSIAATVQTLANPNPFTVVAPIELP